MPVGSFFRYEIYFISSTNRIRQDIVLASVVETPIFLGSDSDASFYFQIKFMNKNDLTSLELVYNSRQGRVRVVWPSQAKTREPYGTVLDVV